MGDLYNHVSYLYPWRELPQVSFLSRQRFCRDKRERSLYSLRFRRDKHVLVETKHVFCRDESVLVVTKVLSKKKKGLSRQNIFIFLKTKIGRDKIIFVATSILRLLSRQKYACLLRQIFVATRTCLLRQIFVATKVLSTFVATNDVFCRDKQYLTRQTRFCRQNICRDKNYTCGTLASDIPQGVMSIEVRTLHSQRPQRTSCCEPTHFFLRQL